MQITKQRDDVYQPFSVLSIYLLHLQSKTPMSKFITHTMHIIYITSYMRACHIIDFSFRYPTHQFTYIVTDSEVLS